MPSVLWRCWLGGRKGIQSVKTERWGAACEVQSCIWPSWCHCHSLSLDSVKSGLVLPFWYRLTWVVPEKGPLSVCVCVCVCARPRACACVRACVCARAHACVCMCVLMHSCVCFQYFQAVAFNSIPSLSQDSSYGWRKDVVHRSSEWFPRPDSVRTPDHCTSDSHSQAAN